MIVCHCVGVTDATIRKLVDAGATSVGEITRRCGAGRCCAPCREEIASLVHSACAPQSPRREFAAADCA